jgi:hypothetical protein
LCISLHPAIDYIEWKRLFGSENLFDREFPPSLAGDTILGINAHLNGREFISWRMIA